MNFIFIMSDSFRFDTLACYTKRFPRFRTAKREIATPNLDRFASISTIFDRSYVGSYPTVPNRKDIFTGKMRPFHKWSPLANEDKTFLTPLKKRGYMTQMYQDTPHSLKEGFRFDRDFDGWEWIRGQEGDRLSPAPIDEPGDPRKTRQNRSWGRHMANHLPTRHTEQDCYCARTMTKAAQWLERFHNKGKFLLYIDTFDPHEPWDAPMWYEESYDPGYKGIAYRYPIYGRAGTYTKAELNHMRACYAGEATLVDRWVGFLLESAERMGLLENTCIIFTADHGILSGEHGWTGKNLMELYEEIARQPLLVHMPGQTRSRRVKSLVQPVDLPATILDLAGAKAPCDYDGASLRPGLEGKPLKTRPLAFSRGGSGAVITSRDWALLYPPGKGGMDGVPGVPGEATTRKRSTSPTLYNLVADPTQQKNVLAKNRRQAQAMWDAYAAWLEAGGLSVSPDQCPRP
jgi:arylsulfatase A-like enzyme